MICLNIPSISQFLEIICPLYKVLKSFACKRVYIASDSYVL